MNRFNHGLALLALVAACAEGDRFDSAAPGSQPTAEAQQALHGGTGAPTGGTLSTAVGTVWGRSPCTGTLIDHDTVLTAAACFCSQGNGGNPSANTCETRGTFTLHDARTETETGILVGNVAFDGDVHVHPGYEETRWLQHDFAVLELDVRPDTQVLGVNPYSVAAQSDVPNVGDPLFVIGRGMTGSDCSGPEQGLQFMAVSVDHIEDEALRTQDVDHHICTGDGGAPALDWALNVVGVASWRNSAGESTFRPTHADVAHHWISQFLDTDGNRCDHATPLELGTVTAAAIDYPDDVDVFSFELSLPGDPTIQTMGSIGTQGFLLDDSCDVVDWDDNSGPGSNMRIAGPLDAGRYFVEVRHDDLTGTGPYALHLDFQASGGCHVGAPGAKSYCSAACPCGEGEGDCDASDECGTGLICVRDVGADYGFPRRRDVCELPDPTCHTRPLGARRYCRPGCPCGPGEGDCNRNRDCHAGLICSHNVGASYGFGRRIDVCEPAP